MSENTGHTSNLKIKFNTFYITYTFLDEIPNINKHTTNLMSPFFYAYFLSKRKIRPVQTSFKKITLATEIIIVTKYRPMKLTLINTQYSQADAINKHNNAKYFNPAIYFPPFLFRLGQYTFYSPRHGYINNNTQPTTIN